MIDRSDAVNLARNVVAGDLTTVKGTLVLAGAVLAMDEYIRELEKKLEACAAAHMRKVERTKQPEERRTAEAVDIMGLIVQHELMVWPPRFNRAGEGWCVRKEDKNNNVLAQARGSTLQFAVAACVDSLSHEPQLGEEPK